MYKIVTNKSRNQSIVLEKALPFTHIRPKIIKLKQAENCKKSNNKKKEKTCKLIPKLITF
jgi:hypothetical protein